MATDKTHQVPETELHETSFVWIETARVTLYTIDKFCGMGEPTKVTSTFLRRNWLQINYIKGISLST